MAETDERTITIDGTEYNLADLSEEARNAAANVSATDVELRRLRVQVGIAQAARKTFADALKANLPETAGE
ncbi:MAG: DUF6447 family protein [Salinisphaeraceae bacterium]